jgi:diguanylate cyclase (GGDEF)-like protein
MNRAQPVEQDEFLAAAALFRYGPWALMIVGAVLSVVVLIASVWRMEVSRQGEYDKAFRFAAASAKAVQATTAQVFALLSQVTYSLQAQGTAGQADTLASHFKAGLGLNDTRISALAVDDDGRIRAATAGVDPESRQVSRLLPLLKGRRGSVPVVLPALAAAGGSPLVVPVVHPLPYPSADGGGIAAIVYLVHAEVFAGVFSGTLDGQAGWLRLSDSTGTTVLDVNHGIDSQHVGEVALRQALRSSAAASASQSAPDEHRLLLASAGEPNATLTATVGLSEATAMKELRARVSTTWAIVFGGVFVVMSLVTVTSVAMRKFATKETHLRRLATIDILTGLPNRRSFHELLDKAVQRAQRRPEVFGLLFVDLDNFKDVNDSMGHEAGDALLQRVSQILIEAVRDEDRVCRLGGDEFTVLLSNLSGVDEARAIGQRILEALQVPQTLRGREVHARASIGVALMPLHASTASDLMRFADTAMYRAKLAGRSICLVYDDSMAVQALEKSERVRELAVAIARDELYLDYQPKFSLLDGSMTGLEALVRWRHPQRGLIPPGDFIGLAEEAGLIVQLGYWVLQRAVRQQREWHDAGAGWQHVAVNVSALQLRHGDFARQVRDALEEHGVQGVYLQLELTESSLVVDAEQARELLSSVRAMGVSISVDDFGTGYSSLSALQQFDVDALKVDRSFVNTIHTPGGEAICRAIVSMAHALDMRVVAEGVETPAQRSALAALGCDEVQGFLCARPMAADKALRLMLQETADLPAGLPSLVPVSDLHVT